MRCLVFVYFMVAATVGSAADRPNILFFLVDDMGVMDTSVPFLTDEAGTPWQRDTLVNIYSVGKPVAAVLAVDREREVGVYGEHPPDLAGLDAAGHADNTLVIVVSDHGEGLGDHGEEWHTYFVYDSTVRVPLILNHPSLSASKRVPEVVSLVDIVPTVLELLEVDGPDDLDGRPGVAGVV